MQPPDPLTPHARVMEAGGEDGRSVSTDQDQGVGQGPRTPSASPEEAYADRTA